MWEISPPAASLVRRSSALSTPDSGSFFRTGMSSSVMDMQLLRVSKKGLVVVRETVTPKTLWGSVGAPLTEEELVRILEASAKERGCWPLVARFDNGGANRSNVVCECLAAHGVIMLFNVPHTPERNAFVEHAIGEAKCACGLDASTDSPVVKLPRT